MNEKAEEERIQKLKRMLQQKDNKETVEQVLVKFCTRSSISLDTCRKYYQYLVASGEIKDKQ